MSTNKTAKTIYVYCKRDNDLPCWLLKVCENVVTFNGKQFVRNQSRVLGDCFFLWLCLMSLWNNVKTTQNQRKQCWEGLWVTFLHSSLYWAVFWICAENSVNNTGMISLLLCCAYTMSRSFLLLTPPHQWVGWRYTKSWERKQLGQLSRADQRHIPYDMVSCSAVKLGRRFTEGLLLGEWLGISQLLVSSYFEFH